MLKRAFPALLALCLLLTLGATAQELAKRLSNQDVIDMVGLGLSDDVIIAKIRADQEAKFDTSTDGLKALKAAKVSDAVIRVMINPKIADAPPAAAPAAPADDPNLPPKEVGVYWRDGARWVPVEGQNVSQAKIGGRWAHHFSAGIASKHWNAEVKGEHSRNVVKDRQPTFYFYVPDGMSAADFTLLKLDKKSDHRQFEVGSIAGWGGGKSGVRESNMRGFDSEHIATRTFKVTITQELKPGEYGFFMATGQAMAMGNNTEGGNAQGRIYDFSIPE
jgi:hypothetical protein